MIVRFVKGIVKLSFYAVGIGAIAGVWDYTQQAKAVEYEYTFAQHTESLQDRFGDEAEYALTAFDSVKGRVESGLAWTGQSGMLEKVRLALPQSATGGADRVMVESAPESLHTDVNATASVEIASVQTELAPETSLFPKQRTRVVMD